MGEAERVAVMPAAEVNAKTPQQNDECGEAQISLGLAAARGKEQQIDELAVRVRRRHERAQIHEDECELKRSPFRIDRRRVASLHDSQSLSRRCSHGAIGARFADRNTTCSRLA